MTKEQVKRFEAKFDRHPILCSPWKASLDKYGYGKLTVDGRTVKAHRLAYELYKGPIPEGLLVMHTCNMTECVNPLHLETGTPSQNTLYSVKSGRHFRARGSLCAAAKLRECHVYEIRASGLSVKALSKLYNVSTAQISRIKKRLRWAHL